MKHRPGTRRPYSTRLATFLGAPAALAALVALTAAPTLAGVSPVVVSIRAESEHGVDEYEVELARGAWNDDTFRWSLDRPHELVGPTTGEPIATIEALDLTIIEDPVVTLNFVVSSGGGASFTVTSAALGFPVLPTASARATAAVTVTDFDGDGASLTGRHPGGNAYRAFFNSEEDPPISADGTVFATLAESVATATPYDSAAGSGSFPATPGYAALGEAVENMSAQFAFELGAGDSASGTSTFVILDVDDIDSDGDGVADVADLCPDTVPAAVVDTEGCSDAQVDVDGDGVCDPDASSDGPSACVGSDNCPVTPNGDQQDTDGDGFGDGCDRLAFSTAATRYVVGTGNLFRQNVYEVVPGASSIGLVESFVPASSDLGALDRLPNGDLLFSVNPDVSVLTGGGPLLLRQYAIYRHVQATGEIEVEVDPPALGVGLLNLDAVDELGDGSYAFSVETSQSVTHAGGTDLLRPWQVWRLVPLSDTEAELELLEDLGALGLTDVDGVDVLSDGRMAITQATRLFVSLPGLSTIWPQNVYILDGASLSLSFDGAAWNLADMDGITLEEAEAGE